MRVALFVSMVHDCTSFRIWYWENGTVRSSEIQVLKASTQRWCLLFSLKAHIMFSINAMNFWNVNDSKLNHRLIRYTKSAIFWKVTFICIYVFRCYHMTVCNITFLLVDVWFHFYYVFQYYHVFIFLPSWIPLLSNKN